MSLKSRCNGGADVPLQVELVPTGVEKSGGRETFTYQVELASGPGKSGVVSWTATLLGMDGSKIGLGQGDDDVIAEQPNLSGSLSVGQKDGYYAIRVDAVLATEEGTYDVQRWVYLAIKEGLVQEVNFDAWRSESGAETAKSSDEIATESANESEK
jgi:hypothetical protein